METLKDSLNKISDALALMNSMILSGERHSDQSTKMFYEAEKAISELSRLKDEREPESNELYPCPYSIAVRCTMVDPCLGCETWAKYKAGEEISRLKSEGEDFPDIDFRRDIANELSRDELIDRLCEMNESYRKMREEWFNVIHLKGKKIQDVSTFTSTDYHSSVEPAEQSDKLTAEDVLKDFISKCRDYSCYSSDINKKRYSFTVAQLCELMEAYHSQFVGENVTDEMIEKWAKKRYEEWLIMANEAHRSHSWEELLIIGAKALRDGKIK